MALSDSGARWLTLILLMLTRTFCTVAQLTPFLLATVVEKRFGIGPVEMSFLSTVGTICALVMLLITPTLIDVCGRVRIGAVGGLIASLGALLFAIAFDAENYELAMVSSVLMGCGIDSALLLIAFSTLNKIAPPEHLASVRSVANLSMALAEMLTSYVMPLVDVSIVFWLAFAIITLAWPTLIIALLVVEKKGYVATKKKADQASMNKTSAFVLICHRMREEYSFSALRQFPNVFKLFTFCGVFKQGFMAFKKFCPDALERCHGINLVLANLVVGVSNVFQLVLMLPISTAVDRWAQMQSITLVSAGILLLGTGIIQALACTQLIAWIGMASIGVAIALLDATGSLRTRTLRDIDRADLITSGNAYVKIVGRLWEVITTQVCYRIFIHSVHWRTLDITPGQFFMVGQAFVLLCLSLFLVGARYLPVQKPIKVAAHPPDVQSMPKAVGATQGAEDEKTTVSSGIGTTGDKKPSAAAGDVARFIGA